MGMIIPILRMCLRLQVSNPSLGLARPCEPPRHTCIAAPEVGCLWMSFVLTGSSWCHVSSPEVASESHVAQPDVSQPDMASEAHMALRRHVAPPNVPSERGVTKTRGVIKTGGVTECGV